MKLNALTRQGIPTAIAIGMIGLLADPAQGQSGYYTKTIKGGSDTSLSLGLLRSEFGGVTIMAVTGGTSAAINATLIPGELDAPGAGDFTSDTYMLLVTSGAKLGAYYTIISNGANDLTLDLLGDTVTTELDGQSAKIIPYWTLDSLMPGGSGITPSTGVPFNGSTVFFNDLTSPGVNLVRPRSYTYLSFPFQASVNGWYDAAVAPDPTGANRVNNLVIFPDEHIVIRNPGPFPAGDTSLVVVGNLLVDSLRISVTNLGDPSGQDVALGVPWPLALTPADLQLAGSPAFTSSTSVPFNGDTLFVFDDVTIGINKPFGGSYTFLEFSPKPAINGWYNTAVPPDQTGSNRVDNLLVLGDNTGLLLRKIAGAVSTSDWVFTSPFTLFAPLPGMTEGTAVRLPVRTRLEPTENSHEFVLTYDSTPDEPVDVETFTAAEGWSLVETIVPNQPEGNTVIVSRTPGGPNSHRLWRIVPSRQGGSN